MSAAPECRAGRARGADQQPLAGEAAARLLDQTLDRLLLFGVLGDGVVLFDFFGVGREELLAEQDQRRREQRQADAQAEPEVLGHVGPVERVDDDEHHGAGGAAEQQQRDDQLRSLPFHLFSLLPISTQTPVKANAATSQATRPSGTGPRCPIPSPPRSSGWWLVST